MDDNKDRIIPNAVPEMLRIGTYAPPNYDLIDQRLGRRRITFGTIENAANQYGVKMTVKDNLYIFSATKNRLQLFVEKLHFAKIPYFEL